MGSLRKLIRRLRRYLVRPGYPVPSILALSAKDGPLFEALRRVTPGMVAAGIGAHRGLGDLIRFDWM